jgi:UDP-GlcNAc3NAcA epimerase
MRALLVVGTRPQIIKSAPLLRLSEMFNELWLGVVHTGQHYDYEMSRVFFNELRLPDPLVNLGVGSGSHAEQTGEMLMGLEKVFNDLGPDVVMVPEDTNSTLAGAIAAVKMGIPVAHVEAGARSFDMSMPEEVNRRVTDHVSDSLFCVSEWCRDQLLREGLGEDDVYLVGDTMYESLVEHMADIEDDGILGELGLDEPYLALTLHRAENTDNLGRLTSIFHALMDSERRIVFPCHPRTRLRLQEAGLMDLVEGSPFFQVVEPVGYYSMLRLIRDAEGVVTDSGGVQKEAFWLGAPCVTLRDNTEWRETIDLGMNTLVGADYERIKDSLGSLRPKRGVVENPYVCGGSASKMILETLLDRY